MNKTKVVHLSSLHSANDARIFHKECKTLSRAGYDVTLIALNDTDAVVDGVKILGINPADNRLNRMTSKAREVYQKALAIDADIYHFHDPELMRVGIWLKKSGKKVIYDVHEDIPNQILYKEWIPNILRGLVIRTADLVEKRLVPKFDAIVCATPYIADRYRGMHHKVIFVNNYPLLNEFDLIECKWTNKERAVCYVGGINRVRGILTMIQALEGLDIKLLLAGNFFEEADKIEAQQLPGWKNVEELGFINRQGVRDVYSRSCAGLMIPHPVPSAPNSLPVKMFEYMSAGIPVIVADFPLWREIVEGSHCGFCLGSFDIDGIRQAIQWVFDHPNDAQVMGSNGRKAVEEIYNWEAEANKLCSLYEDLQN